MFRKLRRFLICFAIANSSLVYSQEKVLPYIHTIDSLMNVAYELEFSYPDSAIYYYDVIAHLAETGKDWLRKGRTHNYRAIVYFEKGDYDRALIHNQRAMELYEKANYPTGIAAIKINTGNIRLYFGDYTDAVKLYFDGIGLYKQHQDTLRLMTSYMNIGTLFYQNGYMQEALNYYTQAIEWAKPVGDTAMLSDLHYNIGNTLLKLEKYGDYENHMDTALIYAQTSAYLYGLVNVYNSLLRYYHQKNHEEKTLHYSRLALEHAEVYGNPYNLTETFIATGLAFLTFDRENYADQHLKSALELALEHNYKQMQTEASINLARIYANKGKYKQAFIYLHTYVSLSDSLFTLEKQKELQELDRKYQLLKKENELKDQQLTIEIKDREIYRKNRIITSSSVFIVFISVSLILMYKVQENKKKLAKKELQRIKSEREKEVLKALLEGEGKERMRIARELHDGINGNLAALKLNMTPLENPSYNHLIDTTMEEIRNLSHNLMPEVVLKFGLKEALGQYIHHTLNDRELDYQFVGNPDLISNEIAVHTYRIVQELISNSIKHAHASEMHIQLIVNDSKLSIAVEDNGKGFELDMTNKHPFNIGIGLSSVENRITYLQGNFDIHSGTGSGTSINIEIPLNTNNKAL